MAGPKIKYDQAGNAWFVDDSGKPMGLARQAAPSAITTHAAPPAYKYEGPQAALNLQRTAQEVAQAQATAAATTEKTRNEATKSGIDVKAAQIDLNTKTGTPPGDPTKTGKAYLATLPAGVRDLANAMLANRYPAVINRNIPVVNQAVLAVNHVNPAFDATRYNSRVQLMNKTLAGNDADELKALNAALGHANVLYDQAAKLPGGADYGFGPLTHGINAYSNWLNSTSPGYKNFLDTMQKYGQEESKVYNVNTGGGQQQTQGNYDVNDPGATIQSNIKNDVRLMAGRAAAILNKYNLGNGGQAPLEPLDPQARAALQRLAPDAVKQFFSDKPDPMASALGIAPPSGGTTAPPSDAQVQAEVKARLARGEDPATTIQWLTTLGRPPSKDTIAAILANRGNQNPDVRPPAQPGSYSDSYLSQGMSGANEGLASVLGAPVDLMTGALNLIPKGINAVANTNIPTISDPFAGSQSFKRGLSEVGSILPGSDDPNKQFARRIGQSVGASVIPSLGAGGSAARIGAGILSGFGGGVGAATAQRIAPGSPGAEMAGDMIGSGLTGLGLVKAAQRAAQRGIEATVPTVDELKSQAANLYQKAEQGGVTATPEQTQQLADGFRKTLQDEGQIGPNGAITSADTNTTKAHNLIQQYAGQPMTPKQMNTVRTVLADSRQSPDASDRRLGNMLLNQFDDWASPLAPQFDQARDVASRYLQTQDLQKARDLAGAQASQFTGSGLENALRTQYRALDRGNIKGQNYFAPDVTDAIQKVARGTALSNTLRGIGKLAPTGVVPGMGDLGGGAMAAMMTGSPEAGGYVAGGLAGAGVLGRTAATRMGINAANQAELIARNGGALDKAPLLPKSVIDYLAAQAAAQQAKYLNGNQQQ